MKQDIIIKFNKDVVRNMTKSQFQESFKKIYPSVDLNAIYDNIKPPKKKEKDEKES